MHFFQKHIIAIVSLLGLMSSSQSQEVLRFELNDKGNVTLVNDNNSKLQSDEATSTNAPDLVSPKVDFQQGILSPSTENIPNEILQEQDWYVGVARDGTLNAIYTLPKGGRISPDILQNTQLGEGFFKVSPTALGFGKLIPSREELQKQITEFVEITTNTVCKSSAAPSEFEATLDLSPAWGFAGKIEFKGKWLRAEVCP